MGLFGLGTDINILLDIKGVTQKWVMALSEEYVYE